MEKSTSVLVTLLQEANSDPRVINIRQKVGEWLFFVRGLMDPATELRSQLNSTDSTFIKELNNLLSNAVVPEFSGRDFTSYDKGDFKSYDDLAGVLLELAVKIMSLLKTHHQVNGESGNPPTSLPKLELEGASTSDKTLHSKTKSQLLKLLPNLLLLIGGNINNPVWSSKECQVLSMDLLKHVSDFIGCNSVHNIVVDIDLRFIEKTKIPKLLDNNLLGFLLHTMEKPLSRNRWEKNPFFCEVFSWLVTQVYSPKLSNQIDQVMAVSLNLIHNHESSNKKKGLLCLKHLIENVSGEELRWYNRVDVIYETLKNQMYSKEECVLDNVLKCIFLILKVSERSLTEKSDKHHEMMTTLLRDTEMENLLVVRRVLISNLAEYILQCGIHCIQHLSRLLHVLEIYLEVEDLKQETARVQALHALENTIIVCWPRIHNHSQKILQSLLKLVINVSAPNFSEGKNVDVKDQLLSKVSVCVKLLLKVSPELHSCFDEIKESADLVLLSDFCDMIFVEGKAGDVR